MAVQRAGLWAVVGALACAMWAVPAVAQPLADRVPADAIVYVGFSGLSQIKNYKGSRLEQFINASELPVWFNEWLPEALDDAAQQAPMPLPIAEPGKLATQLLNKPMALFVTGAESGWKPPALPPIPEVGLLIDAGSDADEIAGQLKAIVSGPIPAPLVFSRHGTLLSVVTCKKLRPEVEAALSGKSKTPLTTQAQFKERMTAFDAAYADSAAVVYVDTKAAFAAISKANPDEQLKKVISELGLDQMHAIIFSARIDQRSWVTRGQVVAPAPRKGIVELLCGMKPLDETLLKRVPGTADFVTGVAFDLSGLIPSTRRILENLNPEWAGGFAGGLTMANMAVGQDIEENILPMFGPSWVAFTDPTTTGSDLLGGVLINKLAKPESAEEVLDQLLAQATALRPVLLQEKKVGKVTMKTVVLPVFSPSLAVVDGHLYMSLTPQPLVATLRRGAPTKSFGDTTVLADLKKRLGAPEKIQSFSYHNGTAALANGYNFITMIAGTGPNMLNLFFGDSGAPAMVLPTLPDVIEISEPSLTASWTDETSSRSIGLAAFPGAEIFATSMASLWSSYMSVVISSIAAITTLGETVDATFTNVETHIEMHEAPVEQPAPQDPMRDEREME